MVVCAIVCVYLNHYVRKDAVETEALKDALNSLDHEVLNRLPELMENLPPKSKEALASTDLREMYENCEDVNVHTRALNANSKILRFAKFALGVFGTLVWGFGDLHWFQVLSLLLLLVFMPNLLFRVWKAAR